MPIYTWRCPSCKVTIEQYQRLADQTISACWDCSQNMERVITAPLLIKASVDVCYDSPIDGKPITSWAAREEDLKQNHCRPYDPEMKTDYTNRLKREDDALDQSIHTAVEEAVEKMPSAKRAKLASDLLDKGSDIEYARGAS